MAAYNQDIQLMFTVTCGECDAELEIDYVEDNGCGKVSIVVEPHKCEEEKED